MSRATNWLFFILLLSAVFGATARAATTRTAASCNNGDVQAVVSAAANGDTVVIPAGSCSWTSGVTVPSGRGITITGTGTLNSTAATTGASASCTQTTITLTVSGNVVAFRFNPTQGNSTSRLSCMQLTYGSGPLVGVAAQGTCTAAGCPNIRWDNLTFTNWTGHSTMISNSYGINAASNVFGVIDHNTVSGTGTTYLHFVEFGLPTYKGVGAYGDNDWAQPENYGSADFLFMENNLFNAAGATENETTVVATGGGRLASRFNTFTNADHWNFMHGWHGTESNGRPRSVHAFEVYRNTVTCGVGVECQQLVATRNGTGLVWGNTYNYAGGSTNLTSLVGFGLYRAEGSAAGWGACDGSGPYDTNDGTTYWSGTIGSVSTISGGYQLTVNGSPGWTTNQWTATGAPYSVHDVTKNNGAEILSNGANTLNVHVTGGPGAYSPSAGDSIQILRATVCIDQGGRGAGRYYSGNPASPSASADQALTPSYIWMNTVSKPSEWGDAGDVGSGSGRIARNRDYYRENRNQTAQTSASSPFDGTTSIGIGHGTIARRPSTCTAGVGYWATDEGTWNQSGTDEQGQLYVCASTNNWTLYYTPYTYPHPLISGSAPVQVPNPPTSLQTK